MNALHVSLYCLEGNREQQPSPGSPYLDSPGRPPADGRPLFQCFIPRWSRTESLGAWERKLVAALWRCPCSKGQRVMCTHVTVIIIITETGSRAPRAPRRAGVYRVSLMLRFPHPWGQRATDLPWGSGWDVTLTVTIVVYLVFAPPVAASTLAGCPVSGDRQELLCPPPSDWGAPQQARGREEAGRAVPSPGSLPSRPGAAVTKHRRLGGLKQQAFILSRVRRSPTLKALGETPPSPRQLQWLPNSWQHPSHRVLRLHAILSTLPSSHKAVSYELGPTLNPRCSHLEVFNQ